MAHPRKSFRKEDAILGVTFSQVEGAADNCVLYVRKLDRLLHADSAATWLLERGPDGLFPPQVFD